MIFLKIHVNEDERALLFKDGNYNKCLKPGDYSFFNLMKKYQYFKMKLSAPFVVESGNLNIFLKDMELLKELIVMEVKDGERALHYEDGNFKDLLMPGRHVFWNVLKKHEFITIDHKKPELPAKLEPSLYLDGRIAPMITGFDIAGFEKGLLSYNGVFQKILEPGRYFFWRGTTSVEVIKSDMRQQQLEIQGQEILTEDKVPLRINFVCHYKIVDPYKAMLQIKNYSEQVYIISQLILREFIGTQKLDDLLKKKQEIGDFVLEKLKEKSRDFGIEFYFAGVKDIILPGEIKEIINTVLIAEKKAQANVIMRREEIASTRSLLNTARLMEENKTLYRLKEMEYLEKICDKIGTISVSGGSPNILEMLSGLVSGKKE